MLPNQRRVAATALMLAAGTAVTVVALPLHAATTARAGVDAAHTLLVTATPGVANGISVSFSLAASGKVVVRDTAGRVAA